MRDIVEWAQSEYGFYVDRHWGLRGWELVDAPIVLADYHAAILRHVFTPNRRGRLPYDVVAWCEPAKGGKSAIAGLCAEYMALHADGDVVLASNKRNQAASLQFASAADSITLNPHLPNVDPSKYEIGFRNGNKIKAIASNARGEAGARFSLAIFDELWGYVHTDAMRLWSEFKTDPTRLNSVKLAIGYAGYTESELWLEQLEKGLKGVPAEGLEWIVNDDGNPACWRNGRHFTFWSHVCRQPWQTDAWIASQKKSLRAAEYRRMILTQFVEGEGNFLSPDAWEALIDPEHEPLNPGNREVPVYVGLDIATKPGGDDCACVGVYPQGGKVKLAFHKIWKGGKERKHRLRLSETVQPYLLEQATFYKLAGVWFDPYQALKLTDDLRARGLRCFEVSQTHATRGPKDTALYEMAVNKELVLYDHPEIRQAAAGANARELGNGLIFLQKAGRGTIDFLIALSNCADEARQRQRRRVRVYEWGGSDPYGKRPKPGSPTRDFIIWANKKREREEYWRLQRSIRG
jgi:hypothetical protein